MSRAPLSAGPTCQTVKWHTQPRRPPGCVFYMFNVAPGQPLQAAQPVPWKDAAEELTGKSRGSRRLPGSWFSGGWTRGE